MIDAHTHLENGDLSIEYVHEFIQSAIENGITHLHILDHTHRFFEFYSMYKGISDFDSRQKAWFEAKQKNSIKEYHALIEQIKKEDLPIKVSFGLEVCFTPENKDFLKEKLSEYPYDFIIGAIHSIDGAIYDLHEMSKEVLWNKKNVDEIYQRYYELLIEAIDSHLFTQIAHPDIIKMYEIYPSYDLHDTYEEVAKHAKEANVSLEDNTGASYRYNHSEVGLNDDFRNILQKNGVSIVSASDAHYPKDVGRNFKQLKGVC